MAVLQTKQREVGPYEGPCPLAPEDILHLHNYVLDSFHKDAGMNQGKLQALVGMLIALNTGVRPQGIISIPLASFKWKYLRDLADPTKLTNHRYLSFQVCINKGIGVGTMNMAVMECIEDVMHTDFVMPFLLLLEARGLINSALDVFEGKEELDLSDPSLQCETAKQSSKAHTDTNEALHSISMKLLLGEHQEFARTADNYNPTDEPPPISLEDFKEDSYHSTLARNRKAHGHKVLFVVHREGLPTSQPMSRKQLQASINRLFSDAGFITSRFCYFSLYAGRATLITESMTGLNRFPLDHPEVIQNAIFLNNEKTREKHYVYIKGIRERYGTNMFSSRTDTETVIAVIQRGAITPAIDKTEQGRFDPSVKPNLSPVAESKIHYLTKYQCPNHSHFGRIHWSGIKCPFYGCNHSSTLMADLCTHIISCPAKSISTDNHYPGTIFCTYCQGWIAHDRYHNCTDTALRHMKYGCDQNKLGVFRNPIRKPLHDRLRCENCGQCFTREVDLERHLQRTKKACSASLVFEPTHTPTPYARHNLLRKERRAADKDALETSIPKCSDSEPPKMTQAEIDGGPVPVTPPRRNNNPEHWTHAEDEALFEGLRNSQNDLTIWKTILEQNPDTLKDRDSESLYHRYRRLKLYDRLPEDIKDIQIIAFGTTLPTSSGEAWSDDHDKALFDGIRNNHGSPTLWRSIIQQHQATLGDRSPGSLQKRYQRLKKQNRLPNDIQHLQHPHQPTQDGTSHGTVTATPPRIARREWTRWTPDEDTTLVAGLRRFNNARNKFSLIKLKHLQHYHKKNQLRVNQHNMPNHLRNRNRNRNRNPSTTSSWTLQFLCHPNNTSDHQPEGNHTTSQLPQQQR